MRAIALLQLLYFVLLAGSVFSSVHIDHAGSHGVLCPVEESSAYCHNSLPHDHAEAHPGEDSLWEHIFEDGASLGRLFVLLTPLLAAAPLALSQPETFVLYSVEEEAEPPKTLGVRDHNSPRAPPALRA